MKLLILALLISSPFILNVNAEIIGNVEYENGISKNSESYKTFTFDGAWCWFSDPRAIFYEGKHKRTYTGWVDSHGDVIVGYYDHETEHFDSFVLEDNFEIDDHDDPALLFSPEGKLMVFFTKHSSTYPILLFVMDEPENITKWDRRELFLNDEEKYGEFQSTYTYANPVMLSEENNRIYLFWRGMDHKPNYSYSDDMGKTWSKSRIFILPERIYNLRRPYLKISSNNRDQIVFAFTDGHPRRESENSIYYMYYKNGSLYNVNDQKIGELGDVPISPKDASLVYDAGVTKQKAWIWDIALDDKGYPALVYAKFSDDSNHIYNYSKWDGENWKSCDLINSGKWFPQTPNGTEEREPNYSGGICLDHENPNQVFISVKRDSVFEIEEWNYIENKNWNVKKITKGSSKDNIRPYAILNAKEENPLQILWMQNTKYIHYTDYLTSIKMNILPSDSINPLEAEDIRRMMRKTADWQLSNPYTGNLRIDWHWGAFYVGLTALYEVLHDGKYLNEIKNIGQMFDWKIMADIYHADRLTIIDAYAWIYEIEKVSKYIDKASWVMDIYNARGVKPNVKFDGNDYKFEWWTWCDALFMAPPSFAKMYSVTGDSNYLDYAIKNWWVTSDYLYSREDSLFYRDDRFFNKKSKNGNKIFWGRGNGWVIAGLTRMLNIIPHGHPSRVKFESQYKEMANKLLSLQRNHNLWTASLYDPEELPMGESSASAFYTYSLAWGINNGLLEKDKFEEPVKKAWSALCANVNENGRLGYVQQVAGDPYPFYENQWHVYATGAFLLCGREMIKLLQ